MIALIVICFIIAIILIRGLIADKISRFIAYSFSIYWFLSLFISTFEPLDFFEVSNKAYGILLLGVMSFIFGLCFPKDTKKIASNSNSNILSSIDKLLTNKALFILLLFLTIYFLSFAKEALVASAMQGKAARATSDSDIYINNSLFLTIYTLVGYPIFNFLLTIIPFAVFNYSKKYLLPIILSLLFIVSFFIINAGRVMFIIMLLYILIMYVIYRHGSIKLSVKSVIVASILGVIAVIGISAITNFRNYGTLEMDKTAFKESYQDTKERVLSYSVLPIVMFDRSLKEDYMSKFGGPLFGKATFAGPELYIGNTIKRLSPNYRTGNDIVINYIQSNFFPVSPSINANFAYTGIFFHYQDFGILGVIFLPFLFGVIFRKLILSFYKRRNIYLMALIGLMYFMMMYSIFCCYLIKPWITFYIPILLYLGYRKKRILNIKIK